MFIIELFYYMILINARSDYGVFRLQRMYRGPRLNGVWASPNPVSRPVFAPYGIDLDPAKCEAIIKAGAIGASSRCEAAGKLDALVLLVVNAAQCKAVLFGENGLAAQMKPGAAVMMVLINHLSRRCQGDCGSTQDL